MALVAGVAVVALGVNAWAFGSTRQVDLSAANRFSLSPESRAIAEAVDAPLDITVFLFEGGGIARDTRFLLNRYRELNPDIDYEIVDPDERPGEARRLGVTDYSTMVLRYRDRTLNTTELDEVGVSSAMLRILRGRTRIACHVVGHGEGDLGSERPDGLSDFADTLVNNGYEARPLDLARDPEVPDDCDVVLLLGARVPLLPEEEQALIRYARGAGRLLVLATPLSTYDPNPLLEPWGMLFTGGLVVDFARSEGLDVSNVIVEDFPTVNPVVESVPRLQLPATGGFGIQQNPDEGLTVSQLAVTSGDSFIETTPDDEIAFSPGDTPGPIVVAAAADDSRVEPTGEERVPDQGAIPDEGAIPDRGAIPEDGPAGGPSIVRTRVVATGSAEWIGNEFIGELGNRRFLANALNWLAEEEQILAVVETVDTSRPLPWTPERQNRVLAVTVGAVPGAVVAAGFVHWLVRRRRDEGPRS